jgi:hypothetical protein
MTVRFITPHVAMVFYINSYDALPQSLLFLSKE